MIVPFEDAGRLLGQHKVRILQGFVMVPNESLIHLILHIYKRSLWVGSSLLDLTPQCKVRDVEKQLEKTLLQDERIKTIVEKLPEAMIEQEMDHNNNMVQMSGSISFADIDRLSKKHFPLCMQEVSVDFPGANF